MGFPTGHAKGTKHRLGDTEYTYANGMWYAEEIPGVSYAHDQRRNNWDAPMDVDNSIMVQDRGIHIGDGQTRNNYISRYPEINRWFLSNNSHGASIGWDLHEYDYVESYVQFHNVSGRGGIMIVFQDVNNHDVGGNEVLGLNVHCGQFDGNTHDIANSGGAGFHWFFNASEPGWVNSAHVRLCSPNNSSSYKMASAVVTGWESQRKTVFWNTYTLKTQVKIRGMRFAGFTGAVNWYAGCTMGWRID